MLTAIFGCQRRNLHARHAKGMASVLADGCLKLSPVHGCLLDGSPALGSLWAAGETDSATVTRLARSLFNRHEPLEPLRPTRNKSHAAAHLSPSLQGLCLGLAMSNASEAEVRASLVSMGVDVLARQSKVSIARFERLVALIGEAQHSKQSLNINGSASGQESVIVTDGSASSSVELCGIHVFLAFVWATARSKRCLLTFLTSLKQHAPTGSVRFHPNAQPECGEWLTQWLADDFGDEASERAAGLESDPS